MAKMRRVDSRAALAQQRAELRRGARGKQHVGDDTGSAAGRAAERAKVHRMQEELHVRQEAEKSERQLALRREFERDRRQREEESRRQEHLHEPVVLLFAELVSDTFRLAKTFVLLPFRVASALRGQRPTGAEA